MGTAFGKAFEPLGGWLEGVENVPRALDGAVRKVILLTSVSASVAVTLKHLAAKLEDLRPLGHPSCVSLNSRAEEDGQAEVSA